MQFWVENYIDHLASITQKLHQCQLRSLSISTMNVFARADSMIDKFLSAVPPDNPNFRILYDKTYTNRMTALPDGHYVFRYSFWDPHNWRKKVKALKITNQTLTRYNDILRDLPPTFYRIKTGASKSKKLFSARPLQYLAATHVKASHYRDYDGNIYAAITTGELSSESNQNNLTLVIKNNQKAYDLVAKVLDPTYRPDDTHEKVRIVPKTYLLVDHGNYGQPRHFPVIHQTAIDMINPAKDQPQPANILLLSQYVPVGKILHALNKAAKSGCRVTVPLEPKGDYRRSDINFRIMFAIFRLFQSKHVKTPTFKKASHVKCLIAKYADGSISMLFGSDNFLTAANPLYRSSELDIFVDHALKTDESYQIINQILRQLVLTGEISSENYAKMIA